MAERHLKIGAIVHTQLIPGYATFLVGSEIQDPPMPQVGIKSVAGHTELKEAPRDSPEYKAWSDEIGLNRKKRDELKSLFTYNFAIVDWSWDGGATWLAEPPGDWQFPKQLEDFGIHPSRSARADYIRYELLKITDDDSAVLEDALGKSAPITNREVDAALGGFQPDTKRRASARRKSKRH